ncbi:LLM class flavin-dependent oxidoreductase [Actinomadura rugatobispora]|uniref:LLM class flavin-dependent oxidoreductase n=1 Tax=Actinomadura rugatobispora TaxID=1994 RepID=A0ABW1A696_9ACTN
MRIGLVDVFDGGAERNPAFMAEFARTVEDLGFDGVWLPEHMVFFDDPESAYPYRTAPNADDPEKTHLHNKTEDGKARVEAAPEQGIIDSFQAAVAMCAATGRLRIGTSVLLLPLRSVSVLAREIATVQELTGGRLDLGVGVGWLAEEFEACGVDFATRGRRAERYLHELAGLWNGTGPDGAVLPDGVVLPEGRGRLPRLMYGGNGDAALRRAATAAYGWYPWNLTPSDFAARLERFHRLAAEAGRARADLHVVAGVRFTGTPDQLPQIVNGYLDAGADGVNVSLRLAPSDYREVLEAVSGALGLTR